MMRRGGFRRPVRPFRRGLDAGVDVPPALRRANELFAIGNYSASAADFEMLARGAEGRFPARAPHLWLRAGQARLRAGHTALGLDDLKRGLSLLAAAGLLDARQRAGQRAVAELNSLGLTSESREITALLELAGAPGDAAPVSTHARPILPTSCPGCGAPLRPDEVEWLDDVTAECAYCGSPLRGES